MPVDFTNNVSATDIHVGATQIMLTNKSSGFPYCVANTPGTACVDVINGFDFKFTGENILGVSVDPASAAAFLPVNGTFQGNTHLGLQLLSNNDAFKSMSRAIFRCLTTSDPRPPFRDC